MTTGIPFQPNKEDVKDVIAKKYGNMRAVAKEFKVSPNTLNNYKLKNPDLIDFLEEVREEKIEYFLDSSEEIAAYLIANYKTMPKLAWEAAKFMLTTQGWRRKYGKVQENSKSGPIIIETTNFTRIDESKDTDPI